jgi:Putative bacterial sensory transduction regulator
MCAVRPIRRARWPVLGAVGLGLGLAVSPALAPESGGAAELIGADPWEIIHIAREFGPAEVGRDAMKDPQIEATTGGLPYRVGFYGCYLGRDCDRILFEARLARKEWEDRPPRAKVFARWNSEKLFGRAWLDDENRAVLDHAVTLVGGVPKENLRDTFERWRVALEEYADHLDY